MSAPSSPERQPRAVHLFLEADGADATAAATVAEIEERLARAGLAARTLGTEAELIAALPEIVFLLVGRPPRIDWSPARALRLLQVAGAGVDPLFPAHGLAEGVLIANTRGASADAVRDHVLALLLALARGLPLLLEQQRASLWRPLASPSVRGQTVALLGLGAIGARVAEACAALGMRVRATRRHPDRPPPPGVERVHGPGETQLAFAGADFAVVCLPLTSATRGAVGAPALAALPASASLINVSRGGIVDETALTEALAAGRLGAAALDVFADEPLPPSSPLWTCPRLVVTPHVAGWTPDYFAGVADRFADNVSRIDGGLPPATPVSRQDGY